MLESWPRRWAFALALALASACGGRGATEFPPGINALQDTFSVAWPACPPLQGLVSGCASTTDPYPQTLATETSDNSKSQATTLQIPDPLTGSPSGDLAIPLATNEGYGWAHGRGYLKYSMAEVWAVLQLPGVVQLSFYPEHAQSNCDAALNVEQGYAVSFETHEVPFGVIQSHYDFTVTFREGIMQGTAEAPTEIGVVYQKTYGATNPGVQVLAGSIIFQTVPNEPNVTSIELIRHLQATDTDGGTQTLSWITEYYSAIVSVLSGVPVPTLCTIDNNG